MVLRLEDFGIHLPFSFQNSRDRNQGVVFRESTNRDNPFRGMATVVVATSIDSGDFDNIQEAIDSLPASGGLIHVKEGTYTITSEILISKSNIKLIGSGKRTKIVTSGNVNGISIDETEPVVSGILIKDMWLYGSGAGATNSGISINPSTEIKIENIFIENFGTYGIYMSASDNITIRGCTIKDCVEDGIRNSSCNFATITENFITTCTKNGILLTADNCIVSNNLITTCGDSGIKGTDSANFGSIIEGNFIDDCGEYGIFLTDNSLMIINNNAVRNCNWDGIRLAGISNCTVTGNQLRSNGQTANDTYSEIHMITGTGDGTYNVISSNRITCGAANKSKYGYREEDANQNFNAVTGNVATGAVTANYSIQGANSTNTGNI